MVRKISGKEYEAWSKEDLIKEIVKIKSTTYGLVWHRDLPEEKIDILVNPDARTPSEMFPNEMAGKPFPVLKEVKNKAIESDKSKLVNLLIEGDNYHSLAVLNFTHREAVDLIYIDPPYNTGNNDFIYNDKLVDKEDSFRHSKWLSFMEKRLKLAKNLLKQSGVIFLSIDDNELAPLRMLCDEIFSSENFLATIVLKNKAGAGAKPKALIEVHEYILMYAKSSSFIKSISVPYIESNNKLFTKKDKHFSIRGPYGTWALGTTSMADRPNLRYPINYNGEEIWPEKQWLWSKERVEQAMKNDELVFNKMKNGKWSVRFKQYLKDKDGILRNSTPTTLFEGPYTHEGTKELDDILGNRLFMFPKPVNLIKKILKFNYNGEKNKNHVILDFFAGSGTTGHAVLELNKEDGGCRSFILCTNNGDQKSEHKIASDICYPRVKKVISGYKNQKEEKVDGLGGNLKYYATDFVEAEPTDKNKRKLVKESADMLCILENAFEFVQGTDEFKIFKNTDKYIGIIFYEEAIEDYKKIIKKIDGRFNTYVFSMGDDPHVRKFADVKSKVSLCAIPEVILKVYREIFK
ncbi:MAG: site-specific DNA-methyltransferase [Candidatus Omnitrophota bacterium]